MPQTVELKKRSKLGYRRTSIACSHCRYRKIRCVVSSEMQNQCESCMRLKKDCNFCPVGQQPAAVSQGNTSGQRTSSSTAHSQFSSLALAPEKPTGMAAGSLHGAGAVQGPVALAPTVLISSNTSYASVIGEALDEHANHDRAEFRCLYWTESRLGFC